MLIFQFYVIGRVQGMAIIPKSSCFSDIVRSTKTNFDMSEIQRKGGRRRRKRNDSN